MKTSNNTILVTGGGSGIGFEMARLFSENENTVIITGRNEGRLKAAATQLVGAHYIVADVTKEEDVNELVRRIEKDFPQLNVLINNAGRALVHNVSSSPDAKSIALEEMNTNYFAVVDLTTKLLPILKKAADAAVVNISSIVALAPSLALPTYSASKSALHAYSQILRLSLSTDSNIKVFEVMPPLVDTEFARDIPSDNKISPVQVAQDLIRSMENNRYEVKVASTEDFYQNFFTNANKAVLALNGFKLN